jgi:hypothetical protein
MQPQQGNSSRTVLIVAVVVVVLCCCCVAAVGLWGCGDLITGAASSCSFGF